MLEPAGRPSRAEWLHAVDLILSRAWTLQVVQGIVGSSQDEEDSVAALGLLAELAECPAALVGARSLPEMATWCFGLATSRSTPLAVRHAAMQVRPDVLQLVLCPGLRLVMCSTLRCLAPAACQSCRQVRSARPTQAAAQAAAGRGIQGSGLPDASSGLALCLPLSGAMASVSAMQAAQVHMLSHVRKVPV